MAHAFAARVLSGRLSADVSRGAADAAAPASPLLPPRLCRPRLGVRRAQRGPAAGAATALLYHRWQRWRRRPSLLRPRQRRGRGGPSSSRRVRAGGSDGFGAALSDVLGAWRAVASASPALAAALCSAETDDGVPVRLSQGAAAGGGAAGDAAGGWRGTQRRRDRPAVSRSRPRPRRPSSWPSCGAVGVTRAAVEAALTGEPIPGLADGAADGPDIGRGLPAGTGPCPPRRSA